MQDGTGRPVCTATTLAVEVAEETHRLARDAPAKRNRPCSSQSPLHRHDQGILKRHLVVRSRFFSVSGRRQSPTQEVPYVERAPKIDQGGGRSVDKVWWGPTLRPSR